MCVECVCVRCVCVSQVCAGVCEVGAYVQYQCEVRREGEERTEPLEREAGPLLCRR